MCLFRKKRLEKKAKKEAEAKAAAEKEAVKAEAPKAEEKPAAKAEPKPEAKVEEKPAEKKTPAKAAAPKKEEAPKVEAEEASAEETKAFSESYTGCFEIKRSKDDRYVFNLYASNHVIIATSQIYASSQSAMTGIKSVIANADAAPVEDQTLKDYEELTYPKWEIYRDKGDQFRFRLSASNGSAICHSQGYTSKASCKNGIESVRKSVKNAEIDKAYLKKDNK